GPPTTHSPGGPPSLHKVWGSSPDDVWMVGDFSTVLRWQGGMLSTVDLGVDAGTLRGVYGTGPGDVWITADTAALHFDGSTWASFPWPFLTSPGSRSVWVDGTGTAWFTDGENVLRRR